jgi:K+-sensing histidine kinase KdpD
LCFDYFFTEPLYSFNVSSRDLPYFFIFVIWAVIVGGFAIVRRRIETDLRETRDRLEVEVKQRAQQAPTSGVPSDQSDGYNKQRQFDIAKSVKLNCKCQRERDCDATDRKAIT